MPELNQLENELLRAADHVQGPSAQALPPTQWPNKDIVGQDTTRFDLDEPPVDAIGNIDPPLPDFLGKYRIVCRLGKGGFGIVYQGYEQDLDRYVAIKVPRKERLSQNCDVLSMYLHEAQIVSNLEHAHIIPLLGIDRAADGTPLVISKFIEGSDLSLKLKQSSFDVVTTAELIACIGDALNFAHLHGVFHRDVKPANIIVDKNGKPYLTDFGLAIRDKDYGKGLAFAGTRHYMSPEQARGEGHRVDGRTDIFSLGTIFYEMLTGRRPFQAEPESELLNQIINVEVRPPRQVKVGIPVELERICLKALSKHVNDRYATAQDMVDDLSHFLKSKTAPQEEQNQPISIEPAIVETVACRVVPKGLRSFGSQDANFFLQLLPGPRDRYGLPESLRFWKSRIESRDYNQTFLVGLLYGPSGCGKTSFVRAALIPHLNKDVVAVYVEASPGQTETRILKSLRKQFPGLSQTQDLVSTIAALRRDTNLHPGKKILIVLDQFEQWLHTHQADENADLVMALRHCDGEQIQCMLMVRDDFWMAITRFFQKLDIPLIAGDNSATVDLFDVRHAYNVLTKFGTAFNALPEDHTQLSCDQRAFLNKAINDISTDGRVIPVRLAVFTEMVKNKTWSISMLKSLGGMEGVGVTFLEEAFNSSTTSPERRYYQVASRSVLKALLPDEGADIRGSMRSREELLVASGYANREREFDDVVNILDRELRLISPSEPEGTESLHNIDLSNERKQHYQLTHDYLVPVLREWLTRKQKETRKGRAELFLMDRAAIWSNRPESRQLPSFWQWLSIHFLTSKKDWTTPERKMMRHASRHHLIQSLILVFIIMAVSWASYHTFGTVKAHSLRDSLLIADTKEVSNVIKTMEPYQQWLIPLLQEAYVIAELNNDARKQLHISLALLPVDPNQSKYLASRVPDSELDQLPVIRDELAKQKNVVLNQLWQSFEQTSVGQQQRHIRVAYVLAKLDPGNSRWNKDSSQIAEELVSENPLFIGTWIAGFRPVKDQLVRPLSVIFRDRTPERSTERTLAANLLADYVAEQPELLANLTMDADEKQYPILFPKLKAHQEAELRIFQKEVSTPFTKQMQHADREKLVKRQANAAVTLLKLGYPEQLWKLLKHSSDPRLRSYIIDRIGRLHVDPKMVLTRFGLETDLSVQRAIVQAMGNLNLNDIGNQEAEAFNQKLKELYQSHSEPGLRAAAEWVLRQWNHQDWMKQIDDSLAKDKDGRDRKLEQIRQKIKLENLARSKHVADLHWYINSQSQAMVVIPGPNSYLMGSPSTEMGRRKDEAQLKKDIPHTFAMAAKMVTVEDFRKFRPNFNHDDMYRYPRPTCPIGGITWFEAAAYCNYLSEKDNISKEQWCYLTDEKGRVTGTKPNYLTLEGYRLPTDAEMEFAARSGTVTSRFFGESEDLLPQYAWYAVNANDLTWPVGTKKPNDFGLFDVYGNLHNWCQESFPEILVESTDISKAVFETNRNLRGLRGAGYLSSTLNLRSAARAFEAPDDVLASAGFRPARTILLTTVITKEK